MIEFRYPGYRFAAPYHAKVTDDTCCVDRASHQPNAQAQIVPRLKRFSTQSIISDRKIYAPIGESPNAAYGWPAH
jgi:hypothetical protein